MSSTALQLLALHQAPARSYQDAPRTPVLVRDGPHRRLAAESPSCPFLLTSHLECAERGWPRHAGLLRRSTRGHVWSPRLTTLAPCSSSIFRRSTAHSLAALTLRTSFVQTILFWTIFRQYLPSLLSWTTVTVPVSLSSTTTACYGCVRPWWRSRPPPCP